MKGQTARSESIRQEEFLWQSTATLGAVVGAEEGAIESIPGNEGRIAQAWVNVRGGLRTFLVYFWHSEGWTPRNEVILETVLKRARTTKHPWLIACDATMSPEDFEKSFWFRKDQMHVIAPEGVSTCRSTNAKREWVEKVYDYVIACNSLKGKISKMKVTEDFESRWSPLQSKEERRGRNGVSKECQRCYLDTVEEGHQDEGQKKKVGKKEVRTREAKKEESETKSLKK